MNDVKVFVLGLLFVLIGFAPLVVLWYLVFGIDFIQLEVWLRNVLIVLLSVVGVVTWATVTFWLGNSFAEEIKWGRS